MGVEERRSGGAEERDVDAKPSQSFLIKIPYGNGGGDCWVDIDLCTYRSGHLYALKILANTRAHIDTQQDTGFSRFGLFFVSFPFFQVRRIVCVHLRSRKELPSSPNKDEDFRDHIFMFCCPAHLSHLKI